MKVTGIEVIPVAMEMPEPLRWGQRNGDQVGSLDGWVEVRVLRREREPTAGDPRTQSPVPHFAARHWLSVLRENDPRLPRHTAGRTGRAVHRRFRARSCPGSGGAGVLTTRRSPT